MNKTNGDNMEGCGAHGCIFCEPKGMGTNGGCMCLRELEQRKRMRVRKNIMEILGENKRLKEIEVTAREIKNQAHLKADSIAYDLMRTVLGEL